MQAVHSRHHQIQQHQIRGDDGERSQGLCAVRGANGVISLVFEDSCEGFSDFWMIFDDKDGVHNKTAETAEIAQISDICWFRANAQEMFDLYEISEKIIEPSNHRA